MSKKSISKEKCEWNLEPDAAAVERAAKLEFKGAEAAYKLLADRGSILSMTNLGHRYEHRGVEDGGPDLAEAEIWYRKAVDSGSAVSTLPFGYFYLRQKDYANAIQVFSIGVDRGYAPSIVRLAHLYANGLGVDKNVVLAEHLLRRASKLKNIWAKIGLAEMYMKTEGNFVKVARGLCLICVAAVQFRLERRFNPESERLKK